MLEKFFHKIWYGKKGFFWCLLWPFSLLYGLIVFLKKAFYKIGFFKTYRAPCKVIIVGNQTIGGGGKTPMVIALVDFFQEQGKQVAVICKGYKGSLTHQPQSVDEAEHTALQVGDEALLLKQKVSCPVIAAQNRVAGAQYLLEKYAECEIIISDDGLTHLALERDLEIILENKEQGIGNGSLLPAGPLRDVRLKQADKRLFVGSITFNDFSPLQNALHFDSPTRGECSIVGTALKEAPFARGECSSVQAPLENLPLEGGSKSLISGRGKSSNQELSLAIYRYPGNIYNLKTRQEIAVEELSRRQLTAIAAIAHPENFFSTLRSLGLAIEEKAYPDHYFFESSDFSAKNSYIMTEKDAVKCVHLDAINIFILPLKTKLSSQLQTRLHHL